MLSNNNRLTEQAIQWVINAVNPEAIILSVQQLQGGISSLVHGVSLSVHGEQKEVVLRQFNNREWMMREPDLVIHEARSLQRASTAIGVNTPTLVAIDETGGQCGLPAVLMTKLEGEVVLEPLDAARWLDGLAQALARIHTVSLDDFPWTYEPYSDASRLDPAWSAFPEKWLEAVDIIIKHQPSVRKRFIHRDYHPANVLWTHGEVSGVVDWVNACIGPAGIDVGHCRVNLALLYQVQTADEFLSHYITHAGPSYRYEPYWDLTALIDFAYGTPEVYKGWTDLGITGLTREIIIERLDDYLISLLKRLSPDYPL